MGPRGLARACSFGPLPISIRVPAPCAWAILMPMRWLHPCGGAPSVCCRRKAAGGSIWWVIILPILTAIDDQTLTAAGFDRSVQGWQVSRLSTGEKQRLAIIRLLHNQPRCLLLDEPTASLDQQAVTRIEQLLLTYSATHQAPVLWVSHDLSQLDRVSRRRLFMESTGHLVDPGGLADGR